MDRPWTDVAQAIGSLGTFLVTTIGLLAVYIQIRKLQRSTWGETNGKLCDQSLEILKLLAEKPSTYPYFYLGKELPPDEPDRVFVIYASEAIANFLEHLALQRENLPPKQWKIWNDFIDSTLECSPVICSHLSANRKWYSEELMRHLSAVANRKA